MLIFLPLDAAELNRLRSEGLRDVAAHTTTPALFDGLGLDESGAEEAEFAALTYASVAALTRGPRRLVAVAEVAQDRLAAADFADDFGSVTVSSVGWSEVTCLFSGDPTDAPAETAAAVAAQGRALAEAWDDDLVADLVATTDLLWYAPQEADAVVAQAIAD